MSVSNIRPASWPRLDMAALFAPLEAARGTLFPFIPVFLGIGVGLYFSLREEPSLFSLAMLAGLAGLISFAGWRLQTGIGPALHAIALVAAGLSLAGARTHWVAAPVLSYHYYGAIEGWVVKVDRSISDAVRLTLDQVRLDDMRPARLPAKVRVSLHGTQGFIAPEPGMRVILSGHLSPPTGPSEPGGFDFQRMAWFDRIGAVGYTRTPVLALTPARMGEGLFLNQLRARISTWVQEAMPGEAGAFAAAVTTGDRAAMGRGTTDALRGSNLAHLLAISGLHMGLLTGFVFTATRLMLAFIPLIALRYPVQKIAAIVALCAGGFYLSLSGGNVATQRAFIMVAAMFIAILFNRRALSIRSVAMAAIVVIILQPESVTEPGFQMSFAATTALIAVFAALREHPFPRLPRWTRPVTGVLLSSAVAGLATAPFAAAHFNQVAYYGLAANMLAVPVMGLIVMPGAVVTALLAPFGLGWLALAAMRPAIEWILLVAHTISSLDGARGQVISPQPYVLPLIALGGLFLILWKSPVRLAGLAAIFAALFAWGQATRPEVLISSGGGLVGIMGGEGRVLSKPKGDGFAALTWLENDGDKIEQYDAAQRAGWEVSKGVRLYRHKTGDVVHLSGRGAAERVADYCTQGRLVILTTEALGPAGDCILIDKNIRAQTGAISALLSTRGWQITTAREVAGSRPWVQ